MKTIKLTENGVEVEYQLTPIGKDLEIPTVISQCGLCKEVFRSFEEHECKPKFEVWKPKEGDVIFEVSYNGEPFETTLSDIKTIYIAFQTKKQALEAHEKALFKYEVEMFIKEKNEGWKPNWKSNERKYYIFYSHISEKLEYSYHQSLQYISNNKYFKNSIVFDELIAKFDNEKLLKWWI
jgi:hypothetical protein